MAKLKERYDFDPQTHSGLKSSIDLLEHQLTIGTRGAIKADLVMSQIKELRSSATQLSKNPSSSPSQFTEATARSRLAGMYEDLIETSLQGNKPVLDTFRNARMQLAKIHVLDAARMPDGLISLPKFASVAGKYSDKAKPLTGNFKTVADFANTYGDVTRNVTPSTVTKAHPWEIAGALTAVPAAVATGSSVPLITAVPALGRSIGPMLGSRGMLQTTPRTYQPSFVQSAMPRVTQFGAYTPPAFSSLAELQSYQQQNQ